MTQSIQESLESCIVFSVKKLDRALDKLTEEHFQKLGLRTSYATILMILHKENGKLQKELAKMLCITAPTLTRLIEKLIHKGYVKIIAEGRTKRVYITDEARELIPDIQIAFQNAQNHFLALLQNNYPDELVRELNKITEKIK